MIRRLFLPYIGSIGAPHRQNQGRRSIPARLHASWKDPLLSFSAAKRLCQKRQVPLTDIGEVKQLEGRSPIGNWPEGLRAPEHFREATRGSKKEVRC